MSSEGADATSGATSSNQDGEAEEKFQSDAYHGRRVKEGDQHSTDDIEAAMARLDEALDANGSQTVEADAGIAEEGGDSDENDGYGQNKYDYDVDELEGNSDEGDKESDKRVNGLKTDDDAENGNRDTGRLNQEFDATTDGSVDQNVERVGDKTTGNSHAQGALTRKDKKQTKNKTYEKNKNRDKKKVLMEQIREKEEKRLNEQQLKSFPVTLRNIYLWIVLVSAISFLKGLIEQYIITLRNVWIIEMRFQEIEVDFLGGLEEFGIIVSLLFISFYAATMNKSRAVFAGVLVIAISHIFFIIPSCLISSNMGKKGPATTVLSVSMCYGEGNNTACMKQANPGQESMAFSLFCLSRIVNGIGTALFMPIGMLYIDDNYIRKKDITLLFGIVLCCNSLGQFIGALLGHYVPMTTVVMIGEPWIIVFIVVALLLLVIGAIVFLYPAWIHSVPSYAKIRLPIKVVLVAPPVDKRQRQKGTAAPAKKTSTGAAGRKRDVKTEAPREDTASAKTKSHESVNTLGTDMSNGDVEVSEIVIGQAVADSDTDVDGQTTIASAASSVISPSTRGKENPPVRPKSRTSSTGTRKAEDKSKKLQQRAERSRRQKETQQKMGQSTPKRTRAKSFRIRNFSFYLVKQIKDPVFVLISVGSTLVSILFRGYHATLNRFLELEYWTPGSTHPDVISGIVVPLMAAIGILVGAILAWHFQLSTRSLALVAMVSTAVSVLGFLILMAFKCQDQYLPTRAVEGSDQAIPAPCVTRCLCSRADPIPVCRQDERKTYASPCHAGCFARQRNHLVDNVLQCDCEAPVHVTLGACDYTCNLLIPVSVLIAVFVLIAGISVVPSVMIVLRNFHEREKYLAVGFYWWIIHLLGHLTGPVIFRSGILSYSCLLWRDLGRCTEEEDVCWNYNLDRLRLLHNGVMALLLALGTLCYMAVWLLLEPKRGHAGSGLKTKADDKGKVDTRKQTEENNNVAVDSEHTEVPSSGDVVPQHVNGDVSTNSNSQNGHILDSVDELMEPEQETSFTKASLPGKTVAEDQKIPDFLTATLTAMKS